MSSRPCLVFSTCPDPEVAAALARMLVERRLAACVNILPAVTSCYRWQGSIETAAESLLLIKTDAAHYGELERAVREHHPYELPEVIMVPIERGLPPYLQWVTECLESAPVS